MTRQYGDQQDHFQRANRLWDRRRLRDALGAFKTGAELGDASCQLSLGYFYDLGLGTRRSPAAALRWYRRAHRGDANGSAATNIATALRDAGKRAAAIRWFKRAIALGNTDAALALAELYLQTKGGVPRALPYLKIARKASNTTEATRERASALLVSLKRR
jgi:TPR repeat protein